MSLDERERPSCVTEAEVSSSSPFMGTDGKFWLCLREMTACVVLVWLNVTRLSLAPLLNNCQIIGEKRG